MHEGSARGYRGISIEAPRLHVLDKWAKKGTVLVEKHTIVGYHPSKKLQINLNNPPLEKHNNNLINVANSILNFKTPINHLIAILDINSLLIAPSFPPIVVAPSINLLRDYSLRTIFPGRRCCGWAGSGPYPFPTSSHRNPNSNSPKHTTVQLKPLIIPRPTFDPLKNPLLHSSRHSLIVARPKVALTFLQPLARTIHRYLPCLSFSHSESPTSHPNHLLGLLQPTLQHSPAIAGT
ncbi:hypothetical protein BT63DRAFT_453837 [Microthyrium microscopicum]|uniref:Uncharacterized protein n=1 Tax=Microthyrium microscopicum TaxID=703497 RepID=A0A6A6UGX6_9PEZI|nr:hypothetical protein BT63DRAFT_453837 [Microthyrium microscopicum]